MCAKRILKKDMPIYKCGDCKYITDELIYELIYKCVNPKVNHGVMRSGNACHNFEKK